MSFGKAQQTTPIFDDGEPTGLITHGDTCELRRALLTAGLCRHAVPNDAPTADTTDRLKILNWPNVVPHSEEHRVAAMELGTKATLAMVLAG